MELKLAIWHTNFLNIFASKRYTPTANYTYLGTIEIFY